MLKTSFWIKLFICHKQRERHLTMTLFVSFSMQILFLSFLYPELPFLLLELLPAWFMYSTDSNSDDTGVCGEPVLHNCVFLPQVSLHFTPRWWRLPRRKINTPLFSCADFWTLLLWQILGGRLRADKWLSFDLVSKQLANCYYCKVSKVSNIYPFKSLRPLSPW